MTITSSTSSAPLVAVVGGTGNQGGSIIAHLATSKRDYRVRTFSRDPTQEKARTLKDQGVDVVKVDLASVEEVKGAFEGAEIVFAMTDMHAHGSKEGEIKAGKIFADAAKAASVKLFIWSGIHNVSAGSGGRLANVAHFDSKSPVLDYAEEIGLNVLNVEPASFFANWVNFLRPVKPNPDVDEYIYSLPLRGDVPVPYIDTLRDLGDWVVTAIELPDSERPKDLLTCGELITSDAIVKIIAKVTDKNVTYRYFDPDQYAKVLSAHMPEGAAKGMAEMWQWVDLYGYYGKDEVTKLQGLQHAPTTAEDFFNRKEVVEAIKAKF